MVSLTQRQNLASSELVDIRLQRFRLLLEGDSTGANEQSGGDIHEEILSAIALNDKIAFTKCAGLIAKRKVSLDSDWCQDDYLLFLLILGNEKFGNAVTFLPQVIDVRRQNSNPVARRINGVFAALVQREFSIHGEFCFLKIPFLYLTGNLRISAAEARTTLKDLSEPGLLNQLSPFMQLLAEKAHDIVLTERQPIPTETTDQLIAGIEKHAKELSIRQWFRAVTALPGRVIVAGLILLLALGLIPVLFGIGRSIVESRSVGPIRVRPTALGIKEVRESTDNMPSEVLFLTQSWRSSSDANYARTIPVVVEFDSFSFATTSFVVEISHSERPILDAIAFTQDPALDRRIFTNIPLERDGPRFRALLPNQNVGGSLRFVLKFQISPGETVTTLAKGLSVRSLQ